MYKSGIKSCIDTNLCPHRVFLAAVHFLCIVHDFYSTVSRLELFSAGDCRVPMQPVQRYFCFKMKLFHKGTMAIWNECPGSQMRCENLLSKELSSRKVLNEAKLSFYDDFFLFFLMEGNERALRALLHQESGTLTVRGDDRWHTCCLGTPANSEFHVVPISLALLFLICISVILNSCSCSTSGW